jgi:uncharacterized membrane protein
MMNLPLHPAVVHLPLGIAFVLPLLAVGLLLAAWRGRGSRSAWAMLVALQLAVVVGGVVALQTGEQQEERVERVVSEAALEGHEERAQAFVWASGAVLLLGLGALVSQKERARRVLAMGVTAGTLAVAALALWTGHSGGELVYVHGAASAYASPQSAGGWGEAASEHLDGD